MFRSPRLCRYLAKPLVPVALILLLVASSCRISDPALEAGLSPRVSETPLEVDSGRSGRGTPQDTTDDSGTDPEVEPSPAPGDAAPNSSGDPASENALDEKSRSLDQSGLGFSGPSTNSHWHAAYAIRICDEVLDPLEINFNSAGIHSHADGLMHIHPSTPEAAWERATVGVFAASIGIELSDNRLFIPDVGEWTNGDTCDGEPAELSLARWAGPEATSPWITYRSNIPNARLFHDGELFTISFAPTSRLPVKPPSSENLTQVSPALLNDPPDPFVVLPPEADRRSVSVWIVDEISESPCGPDEVIEAAEVERPLCFSRSDVVLDRSDIVGAEARVVNRSPGVVLDLSQPGLLLLNEALFESTDQLRLAVEVDGEVAITVAFSSPLTERRFAFTGGMTIDDARQLAGLLGSA